MNLKLLLLSIAPFLLPLVINAAEDQALVGVTWSITEIKGVDVVENSMPSLTFSQEGGLSATAGCNRMVGSFEIDSEKLSIGQVAATRMMCPEPLMSQEANLINVFESTQHYLISDNVLILFGAEDSQLLTATLDSEL